MLNSLLGRLKAQHFARLNGLVYFGYVDRRRDEHVLVKGFTLSAKQTDRHYMSGSVNGIDTTLLQRTDFLQSATKKSAPYTWLIGEFNLPANSDVHALLLSKLHPRSVYEAVFIKLAHYQHLNVDPALDDAFLLYAHILATDAIREIFRPELIWLLASAPHLDVEIDRDKLYVYHATNLVDTRSLIGVLKHGLNICQALSNKEE